MKRSKFRPKSYYNGGEISLAGSLILLLLPVAAVINEIRKKNTESVSP